MRLGMMINLAKCVGCYACAVKCKQEHFLPPGMLWARLIVSESGKYPHVAKQVYPVLCFHCKEPACVKACPTGATQKRGDGVVWVDQDKCVGCRYCLVVCPFQVRSYYDKEKEYFPKQGYTDYEKLRKRLYPLQTGVVLKCNFCLERIDAGIKKGLKPGVGREATPACVNVCPAKARFFGDIEDPESEVSSLIREKRAIQLHPEYGTDPSVYYALS